jgi:hypothetical protein
MITITVLDTPPSSHHRPATTPAPGTSGRPARGFRTGRMPSGNDRSSYDKRIFS